MLFIFSSCSLGSEHVTKGMHYYSTGDFVKAEQELLQANINSLGYYSEKEYYTILGNCYNELERYDESIVYHKKSIEEDPNYADAWVNLGIVHRLTGSFDEAMNCYNKANSINPNDPELHASMGALYVYLDNPQKAQEHLKSAIQLNSNLIVAHSNYSIALAMMGKFGMAEREISIAESMGYTKGYLVRERILSIRKELKAAADQQKK